MSAVRRMRQDGSSIDLADWRLTQNTASQLLETVLTQRLSRHHKEYTEQTEELRATITTSRRGGMASGGDQRVSRGRSDVH